MVLMGTVAFIIGTPSAPTVNWFALAPQPQNYMTPGAIQELRDVVGTLATFLTLGTDPNAEIRGAATDATDTLTADPALGGVIVPTWAAAGVDNERGVVLTYDGGLAPAGDVSVVRCVWKGVDILIFCTFSAL